MVLSYKRFLRITFKLTFVLLFLGCIYVIIFHGIYGELFWVFPIIVFCFYGFFHTHTLRIHLSSSDIIWEDFLMKKVIKYNDVTKVIYYNKVLEIKTNNKKIKIGTDIKNQKSAIEYFYKNLKQINKTFSVENIKNSYDLF